MKRILIIEDEVELVRILRSYLENAGYQVLSSYDGMKGFQLWQQEKPDLVILDLNLPGLDGLEVAKRIRKVGNTPMIMLTARVDETDQLIGLALGADDYITKPFSPKLVVAKVQAVLRRFQSGVSEEESLIFKDIIINLQAHTISVKKKEIDLTPSEFKILTTLVSQPGRVFSRSQLLEEALSEYYDGYERTIDAHIKNIRAKIEPNPKVPVYVETVFGVGYRCKKN